MARNTHIFDVFISHNHGDTQTAAEVAAALKSYKLEAFFDANLPISVAKSEDAIWEAMAECRALIAIIPSDTIGASMAFELGAAKGWNKPIYGVTTQASLRNLPAALNNVQVFPKSRVEEVAELIARSLEPLSEDENDRLIAAYCQVAVPCDQLAAQPKQLMKLVKLFNRRGDRQIAGEQLLSFLLRLRKGRRLPVLAHQS